jgi:hypothetical protein
MLVQEENQKTETHERTNMSRPSHLVWLLYGVIVSFGASFVFGDLLTLPVDLYYLIYFSAIIGFLVLYIKRTGLNVREWISNRLWWGILAGLIIGALMVQNVLSRPATKQFTGAYLVWMIFWRGIIYGSIDGLILYTFPWLVTWRSFNVRNKPMVKKIIFGALALAFILLMTTTYHLGYRDFRSKKIIQPNIGSAIMSIPTLVTVNPLASAITHVIMHVSAVVHLPETELFLPPHRDWD